MVRTKLQVPDLQSRVLVRARLRQRTAVPELVLPRRGIVRSLAAVAGLLVLCSIVVAVLRHGYGHDSVLGLSRTFDLNRESNLPTWYHSAMLLSAALLTAAIARIEGAAGRTRARRWVGLALVILLMSIDEIAMFHERLTVPRGYLGPFVPIHRFSWVLFGLLLILAVAAMLARLLLAVPRRTRNGILAAGALYVTGAVGMEVVGGLWALGHGEENPVYAAMTTLEECLELAGAVVLIDTLLAHLAGFGSWRGQVRSLPPRRAA